MDVPEAAGTLQIPKSLFWAAVIAVPTLIATGGFYMGHLQAGFDNQRNALTELKVDVLAHRAAYEANARMTDATYSHAISEIKSTTDRIEAQMKFVIDDRQKEHK